jgi:hypothetical protein
MRHMRYFPLVAALKLLARASTGTLMTDTARLASYNHPACSNLPGDPLRRINASSSAKAPDSAPTKTLCARRAESRMRGSKAACSKGI